MSYKFIHDEQAHYSIEQLCQTLDVSCSGYYAWLHCKDNVRASENKQLKTHIRLF